MNIDWNIQKRSSQCVKCQKVFDDHETIHCFLNLSEREPVRKDLCRDCWEPFEQENEDVQYFSYWQTRYRKPVPVIKQDPVKRDLVEMMLKKYLQSENPAHRNLCYILAVMLERKKIIAHKDSSTEPDGTKILVYEHNKTGDTFVVADPQLKLGEIAGVQHQVKAMLDAELHPPAPPAESSEAQEESTVSASK